MYKICDFMENNVGREIFMDFKRMGSQQIQKIQGIIKTSFSNDCSPVCEIQIDGIIKEIFLDEVRDLQLI